MILSKSQNELGSIEIKEAKTSDLFEQLSAYSALRQRRPNILSKRIAKEDYESHSGTTRHGRK